MSKCPECQQDVNVNYYCEPCNSGRFRNRFQNWTSGDDNLNQLIRESQLNAGRIEEVLEWIDYSNLKDIEYFAEGGFGSVYKAIWKDGTITYKYNTMWDMKKSEWTRQSGTMVAMKKYRNLTFIS